MASIFFHDRRKQSLSDANMRGPGSTGEESVEVAAHCPKSHDFGYESARAELIGRFRAGALQDVQDFVAPPGRLEGLRAPARRFGDADFQVVTVELINPKQALAALFQVDGPGRLGGVKRVGDVFAGFPTAGNQTASVQAISVKDHSFG